MIGKTPPSSSHAQVRTTSTAQTEQTQAPAPKPSSPPTSPTAAARPGDGFGGSGGAEKAPVSLRPTQAHVPVHQPGRALYGSSSRAADVGASTPRAAVQPQHQRKQEYGNSCGAASLLCASMELGKTHLPTVEGELRWQGQPLDTRTSAGEQAIYSVSSGTANPNGDLKNEGYSQPDKLIQAADRLGLKSHVQLVPGFHSKVLETFKPGVGKRLDENGVEVKRGSEQPLNENQRRLRVVTANVGPTASTTVPMGLHYIMERPNGSVMDPATGFDYNNFSTLNKAMAASSQGIENTNGWLKGSYTDTGISIVVEPK